MKTYRNAIALTLTLAFVTIFTGLASAQGHGMMGGGMMGRSPEQQASMQKMHANFSAATADLNKKILAKESELNAQLFSEKTDDKKVEALTTEINALRANLYTEQVKLNKQMAKEGIMPMGSCPMMGGGMQQGGMGMMGGGMQQGGMGMMGGGMQPGNGTMNQTPTGHGGNAPANQ
jgi:zinc resistance-associated protein